MKTLKLLFIVMCVLFGGAVNGFSQMTSDEALSVFISGGIAYKDGRYDEAISQYEKIYDGRRVNGPLHYNLANSYFKKENLGKSLLNYERARQFMPRDSDLNFNYSYVRSQIKQPVAQEKKSFINRVIQGYIQFYTIDEMVIILVGLIVAIGIVFLSSLYVHWPRSVSRAIILVLSISFFIYGLGLMAKIQHERDMAIVMGSTESYFEPRADSTVHFKLSEGMKVRILKSEGHWMKIERLDGKIGWVDQEILEKI